MAFEIIKLTYLLTYLGTVEERGMAVTRGQQDRSDKEVDSMNEVYELPLSTRCRTTTTRTPFCRYVPFMPCYDDRHIASKLRRALDRVCRCCRPTSDCV